LQTFVNTLQRGLMNITELKAVMAAAFREEGLEERALFPKGQKVWTLTSDDLTRFFWPAPVRRPWGFSYMGYIGIDALGLRAWLGEHKPGAEAGIFQSCFLSYFTLNDEIRQEFMVDHGKPIPADLWASLLRDRLDRIPSTLDALIDVYRQNRAELGHLAHPHTRHAWDFLIKWRANPDPALAVPKMMPDGRIV
jgi:hypothetical protein